MFEAGVGTRKAVITTVIGEDTMKEMWQLFSMSTPWWQELDMKHFRFAQSCVNL